MQVDDAAVEAVEGDVAAVLRHRRADARVEQLLDLADDLLVGAVVAGVVDGAGAAPSITGWPDWKCSMIAPRMPGLMCAQSASSALVTVTKSGPKNTPATPPAAKMRRASGEAAAAVRGGEVGGAGRQHRLAGQELQRRGVRRRTRSG